MYQRNIKTVGDRCLSNEVHIKYKLTQKKINSLIPILRGKIPILNVWKCWNETIWWGFNILLKCWLQTPLQVFLRKPTCFISYLWKILHKCCHAAMTFLKSDTTINIYGVYLIMEIPPSSIFYFPLFLLNTPTFL